MILKKERSPEFLFFIFFIFYFFQRKTTSPRCCGSSSGQGAQTPSERGKPQVLFVLNFTDPFAFIPTYLEYRIKNGGGLFRKIKNFVEVQNKKIAHKGRRTTSVVAFSFPAFVGPC